MRATLAAFALVIACHSSERREPSGSSSHTATTAPDAPANAIGDVLDVEVGSPIYGHAGCILQKSGRVSCWAGPNILVHFQRGRTEPLPGPWHVQGLDDAVALFGTARGHCAIRRNGEGVCWNGDQQQPIDLDELAAIAGSGDYLCALRQDGTVHCSGSRPSESILMLGWQFDSRVPLLRGPDATRASYPLELLRFLSALCEERPELDVHILAWEGSALFAFEREPLQSLTFKLRSHRNLRFEVDSCHPVGASQHQKLIVVDRSVAFLGGMDVCSSRWDVRAHHAVDERRAKPWPLRGTYGPYHDVQAYVTGEAVDRLRQWFAERWKRARHENLVLPAAPRKELSFRPTIEVNAPAIALARTLPELDDPPCTSVDELRQLHLRAIAAARGLIYIENQYYTSDEIQAALIERMRRESEPVDIAIVLPARSAGIKEQVSIGVRQVELLRGLQRVASDTGSRVGVYYQTAVGPDGEVPVFIHSKILAVDDRFLLVSSANTTNRSMGLDTELGVAWESPEDCSSLRAARIELMREHCGLDLAQAKALLGSATGMVERLDQLARSRSARLRIHPLDESDEPGETIAHAIGDSVPLDPAKPVFETLFPETPKLIDSHITDRLFNAWRSMRNLAARGRRAAR